MSNQRIALISGISGQDGSYLAEHLLSNGYEVHGILRRNSTPNTSRINHILNFITLHQSDITDQASLIRLIDNVKPHEVYNLAANSFVGTSWDHPVATCEIGAIGVLKMLEAIRYVNKDIRFYQASSSEMFGKVQSIPQVESTPFYPRSPYGVAKLYGHWMTINYRESHNMYAVSGILYNHESERRGLEFVTRKITNSVARIVHGKQNKLFLGNIEAKRDWGHAMDYCAGMHLMLQQDTPDDYILSSGETHSVKEFVELAFERVNLDWYKYVELDEKLFRPAEVQILLGDSSKARKILGWKPTISFQELVNRMVDNDLKLEAN